jgi:hypothetical protein
VTIRQEILEELRKGTPLAEVGRKFRSKRQEYEAIRPYLPETDKNTKEQAECPRSAKERLSSVNVEFQRIDQEEKIVFKDVHANRQQDISKHNR